MKVSWHENFDLQNIITPVNVKKLKQILQEVNYCPDKSEYLIDGFTNGFSLEFQSNREVRQTAPNLKFRIGDKYQLWEKVIKEVESGRYAGPFEKIPFSHYIQSPIGLVPKEKGKKTRLIFHLSYPRGANGNSVNAGSPRQQCTIQYPSFDEAVKLCIQAGVNCGIGKSDMTMAFRQMPCKRGDWPILIMKAYHPESGKLYYFVDKCLPFGSSISCKIFQEFSDAIAYVVRSKTKKSNVNYLDDFLFVALLKAACNHQLQTFIDVCNDINFPISMEKTFWATAVLTFLGLLLDTKRQVVCIPKEKIDQALMLIQEFLGKKKGTVHRIQKLCSTFNFLCRCIVPGRAFLRHTYSLTANNKLKPHHHVSITNETKEDMKMWRYFLLNANVFCRPFMDFQEVLATEINLLSDAAKSQTKGFGAICDKSWMYDAWNPSFIAEKDPSIKYLEIFAVTAAVLTWIKHFKNKRIYLFCNNESAVHMINNSTSKCKNCMVLLRFITLENMIQNIRVFAKHVSSQNNGPSDALSCLQLDRFFKCVPDAELNRTPIPDKNGQLKKFG